MLVVGVRVILLAVGRREMVVLPAGGGCLCHQQEGFSLGAVIGGKERLLFLSAARCHWRKWQQGWKIG